MKKINIKKRFFIIPIIFILLVFINGFIYGQNQDNLKDLNETHQIIKNITKEDAYILIENNQNNENFLIIDLRKPEEIKNNYLKNSINLNYFSKDFKKNLHKLNQNKTYLIYCKSGGRSGRVLKIMKELNFKNVYNISEGII